VSVSPRRVGKKESFMISNRLRERIRSVLLENRTKRAVVAGRGTCRIPAVVEFGDDGNELGWRSTELKVRAETCAASVNNRFSEIGNQALRSILTRIRNLVREKLRIFVDKGRRRRTVEKLWMAQHTSQKPEQKRLFRKMSVGRYGKVSSFQSVQYTRARTTRVWRRDTKAKHKEKSDLRTVCSS
jgi:hypothetical protein